jgi:CBS domain-containing protein
MRIDEFMTTRIASIDADLWAYDAIEKMVDRRIRSLLVRFKGKNNDYGVITARDIVFKVLAKGINPTDIKVSSIAAKPIVCVSRDVTLAEASALMEKSHIARVFVCDADKIVGVVSLLDIMSSSLIMRARGENVP